MIWPSQPINHSNGTTVVWGFRDVTGSPSFTPSKLSRAHANVQGAMDDKRLYLRLGDKVLHHNYEEWGEGVVVEEMTSSVPGGTCLVRILFGDGTKRTFNNDMDNELCCYFFGIRKMWQFNYESFGAPSPKGKRTKRRITRCGG